MPDAGFDELKQGGDCYKAWKNRIRSAGAKFEGVVYALTPLLDFGARMKVSARRHPQAGEKPALSVEGT